MLQGPANAPKDVMELALEKIRQRVDTLGVAEPDISLLGSNTIQVQLPGLGGQGTVKAVGGSFCVYTPQGKQLSCYSDEAVAQAKAKELSDPAGARPDRAHGPADPAPGAGRDHAVDAIRRTSTTRSR